MKLVTYTQNGKTYLGEMDGDRIYRSNWQEGLNGLMRRGIMPERTSEHVAVSEVKIHAPAQPGKIIGIGRNYADHAAETKSDLPTKPLLFAKFINSIIGPGDLITWNEATSQKVDWEGELAVVIGKQARKVSEAEAYDYIFGYTIANDVSARDLQQDEPQWLRAKGLDTFCPLGPCVVTRDEIPNPHNLTITTRVNDEVTQQASTDLMVFKIPYLVSYISHSITLEPGDMILTGTPAGVGLGMNPPRFLKDGDVVSITIDGIGTLTNACKVV